MSKRISLPNHHTSDSSNLTFYKNYDNYLILHINRASKSPALDAGYSTRIKKKSKLITGTPLLLWSGRAS
jgi:hypothetical protein